jgi:hypothetical protein
VRNSFAKAGGECASPYFATRSASTTLEAGAAICENFIHERQSVGEVCGALQRLQKEFLIEMEDAAYITRERDGKIRLHQTQHAVGERPGLRIPRHHMGRI